MEVFDYQFYEIGYRFNVKKILRQIELYALMRVFYYI